jgi:uncharacterized protein (TIGR03067 family)
MCRIACFALVCAAAGWAAAQGTDTKEDLKKMQGKWRVVEVIEDGKEAKPDAKAFKIISDNKVLDPGAGTEDEFRLDATKKPKELDVYVNRKGVVAYQLKGIYEFQGEKLRVCIDLDGKGRPKAFESKPGSGYRLATLERVKD